MSNFVTVHLMLFCYDCQSNDNDWLRKVKKKEQKKTKTIKDSINSHKFKKNFLRKCTDKKTENEHR